MKYAYYKEIHSQDLANIPYFYWWRSSVLVRANNIWHDLVCIANGSATIKTALFALLAVILSPFLLLLSPSFSYEEQKVFKKNRRDVYYQDIELYYVPSKYITKSDYCSWVE